MSKKSTLQITISLIAIRVLETKKEKLSFSEFKKLSSEIKYIKNFDCKNAYCL